MSEILEASARLTDTVEGVGDESVITTATYPFMLYVRNMLMESHLLIDEVNLSHWQLKNLDNQAFKLGRPNTD